MNRHLWDGALLVARQEFRVRLRTGRWRWLLAVWVGVVGAFTALLSLALFATDVVSGVPLFGGLMLFVLALVLLVSPALTAQAVNGDRERGTLATLQVTRLSPTHIALGKLLAGWAVGLSALALTLPFVAWSIALGGVGVLRAVVVLVVVALLIGVICAVSQALSALFARSIASALVSYLVVFALTIGTVVAFGLALPLTAERRTGTYTSGDTYDATISHPEQVWWLLAPNPFVVLADAAPKPPPRRGHSADSLDPLSTIGVEVRRIRRSSDPIASYRTADTLEPVWPYGLAFNVLLGAGAVLITVRRLHTPADTVPRGVRIA
jgi:ABC-type transport system involved in multi-copper enzyme maturation permease subunit